MLLGAPRRPGRGKRVGAREGARGRPGLRGGSLGVAADVRLGARACSLRARLALRSRRLRPGGVSPPRACARGRRLDPPVPAPGAGASTPPCLRPEPAPRPPPPPPRCLRPGPAPRPPRACARGRRLAPPPQPPGACARGRRLDPPGACAPFGGDRT
ncbi:uncharacterized protein [Equus przewalskii]|uniref:Basic proline-rich protein-like n=1 Tax=Equus przewalskii TaxID=9798 RepID=A0ABM4M309_EQUPR